MNNIRKTFIPYTTSGKRKSWYKIVTGVDPNGTNGYAIGGEFIQCNKEVDLNIGDIVIEVRPRGSVKNNWQSVHIYDVTSNGLVECTITANEDCDWRKNFLTIRDFLLKKLNEKNNNKTNQANLNEKLHRAKILLTSADIKTKEGIHMLKEATHALNEISEEV